ncbi:MAG: hypothetical protein JWO59_793 [Chloroflexi bacterium]|nr:hypothetical protein [Chloroflexota bacterium]
MQSTDIKPLTSVHALKEWAVAIDALRNGQSLVTVRKGGIREDAREFRMEHRRFLLFPTYEHQNPDQLREEFVGTLDRVVAAAPSPGLVEIDTWAEVSDVIEVTHEEQVRALSEFSVFSPAYAIERLQWRPRKPLHVLVLRIFRLESGLRLPLTPAYGGCKSWITLDQEGHLDDTSPALSTTAFETVRERVLASLRDAAPHVNEISSGL